MKKITLILIFLATVVQSCNNDDCNDCFTPPPPFKFELVDKTSGENVFTNGTFAANQIQIVNVATNAPAQFTFISENNINLIQSNGIGFQTEVVNLKIASGNTTIFNFFVDAERKRSNCCSFTAYNEIQISNAEFELNTETGTYKILVE